MMDPPSYYAPAPMNHQSEDVALIALMGPTGSGKTTFINTATRAVGSRALRTSAGVKSCTDKIQVSEPIVFQGRVVKFIDTPGFDDTEMSDVDILRMIAVFLAESYSMDKKLSGIIYTKDISQIRMTGSACHNLRLFRALTGDKTLDHVAIVTTMWSRVSEAEGLDRLEELMDDNNAYFAPMLKKRAVVLRYDNTTASAHRVLEHLFYRAPNPTVLQIQTEMVKEMKELDETAAGAELGMHLAKRTEIVERGIVALRAERAGGWYGDEDEESRREMEEEYRALERDIERLRRENEKLKEKRSVWMDHVKAILVAPLSLVATVVTEALGLVEDVVTTAVGIVGVVVRAPMALVNLFNGPRRR